MDTQVEIFEREQIGRAVYFTACRFLGRGRYSNERTATLAEARDLGTGDGRLMLYAVTPEGWTIHVENV